jgi:hypothetical protein
MQNEHEDERSLLPLSGALSDGVAPARYRACTEDCDRVPQAFATNATQLSRCWSLLRGSLQHPDGALHNRTGTTEIFDRIRARERSFPRTLVLAARND